MSRPSTAQDALDALRAGNLNFVQSSPAHPRQDADLRRSLAIAQTPFAALFGCSGSRLSAEMIFDVGLGDLFVVRNAGQVIADTSIGSLEFAVSVLKVPLILVLGHDNCGAVKAALEPEENSSAGQSRFMQNLVARIQPTIARARALGQIDLASVTTAHIIDTIDDLMAKSELIAGKVSAGELAVVGAHYELAECKVGVISVIGNAQ